MPTFDVDREQLYVFPVDDMYYFSEYFDHTDLFESLSEYYDDEEYHFAVPAEVFESVESTLEEYYYEPVVVEDLDRFCVVKDQYTDHAEILKQSVLNWERAGQLFFLMRSPLAVDDAVERGARRLAETEYVLGL